MFIMIAKRYDLDKLLFRRIVLFRYYNLAITPFGDGIQLKAEAMADATQTWIDETVRSHPVVLFMKGTPQVPLCGFSAAVSGVLQHLGVAFKDVDVLAEDRLRDGIKAYANWPTIPQLYVNGEFVGGYDIVREMYEAGELQEILSRTTKPGNAPSA
jgi:monothiol glutaredoxin